MVDIVEVSAIVAAAGVLVGVVFTVMELRNLVKQRQTDLVMRLWQESCSEEQVRASSRLSSAEYQDFNEFIKKYGHPFSENPVPIAFRMTTRFFEGIGIAAHLRIVDIGLVFDFFTVGFFWEKVKPVAEGLRKQRNNPHLYEWFEYLANEKKKYYQQLASKTT